MSKKFVKIGAVLFVLVLALLVQNARNAKPEFVAKAASLRAIPKYCLGGWENPTNAAGQPEVADGEVNGFTTENSSVLSQKSAQLFCGIFETDDMSFTPTRAVLHLSWRVDFVPHEDADATMWQEMIASSTEFANVATGTATSAPAEQAPAPIIETSTPAAEATSTVVAPQPVGEATTETTNTSQPAPAQTTSTETNAEIAPPPPASQATSTTTSAPLPPEPTPASVPPPVTATTSASLPWYQNIFALITPRVFAEGSSPHPTSDFLEITYTTDGKNWKSVGKVSESNWKNATVEIPVTSWDEINKLQIALTPLFSADAPTIYLDGMWLEVHHDISLLGVVNTGISAVSDATQSVAEAVGNLLDSAISAVADVINPQPKIEEKNVADVPQAPAPEPKKPEFHFDIGGDIPVTAKIMPWVRSNEQQENKKEAAPKISTLTPNPTSNAFTLSGACAKPYFVVLVFANKDDYTTDPSRAVINRAGACTGGSFSFVLKSSDFSSNLADGTYYVIVGEQGMRESWQPTGAMFPIVITRVASSTTL